MTYQVAVRMLCEFTAKQGDLDLRFTPAPSAQEGIAGHLAVQRKRGADYEAELPLQGQFESLRVRGRADGYDPRRNQLEEIKTFRGELEAQPDNHRQLHWAQARIYAHLLCQERDLDGLWVALVYYDVARQRESVIRNWHEADELRLHFEHHCRLFLAWARQEQAHRQARDRSLRALNFPHPQFRAGQRQLAEAVYRAATREQCLMVEAPTGIGKTLGTLFPQLKAMPGQALDKLFYLAAKTPGRQLALEALKTLNTEAGPALRVLELSARDKTCEHPDKACHGDACPLAQGFYDRLPAAREEAVSSGWLDQAALRTLALKHGICPYYLSQEMARWADLVVGDYNYFYDLSALLHALTEQNQWQVGVLTDEAHNLVDRARSMYSAELSQSRLRILRKQLPARLKRPVNRLNRIWNALAKTQTADYQVHESLPWDFIEATQFLVGALTEEFTDHPEHATGELQRWYFDLIHFTRVAERYDQHYLFDLTLSGSGRYREALVCLRNLVPAPALRERFDACHTAVLFSATLSPSHYYRDMLGLPEHSPWLSVESPFRAEQLSVQIVRQVSTRYRDRTDSIAPIVALMAQSFAQAPGNYLAFFSSFEYLNQVAQAFSAAHPRVPVWCQLPGMDEASRRQFLDRFATAGRGIGFAVLGGAFGEGIDLPGDRLVGAFIATLGLPPLNPVNEQFRTRLDALFNRGYDYTYLFPGLQKVIQAAGRVIRTDSDRGRLYLIDDRFDRAQVRTLLPQWWRPTLAGPLYLPATTTAPNESYPLPFPQS